MIRRIIATPTGQIKACYEPAVTNPDGCQPTPLRRNRDTDQKDNQ